MSVISVSIDSSQFPENIQADLLNSLRQREVNHKFHYDSVEQTQKWLALHEAYSPARTDTDCLATYDLAFAESVANLDKSEMDLISLGCGGGQKDLALLREMSFRGGRCRYFPCDVATAMALVAHRTVSQKFPAIPSQPAVCDLQTVTDLAAFLATIAGTQKPRLLAFFGMMPNFMPDAVLPKLSAASNPGDHLILSANLAPGPDYRSGVQRVLPLYDNDLTKEWLVTFLLHLGVERSDGKVVFQIEPCPSKRDLLRMAAYFAFERPRTITVSGERFEFKNGERVRLFYSYRYTPERIEALLNQYHYKLVRSWITRSQEEGIFLCQKDPTLAGASPIAIKSV
jgi:L-histidine N-alpha-methyltransferase